MKPLVVAGGVLVTPEGSRRADLLLEDGIIAALGEPGSLGGSTETLDARGLTVLPGLVDAHVHLRDPGLTHKEDLASATDAAAAGGVTTIMAMPFDVPPVTTAERLQAVAAALPGRARVDLALQAAADRGAAGGQDLRALAAAGAVSLELLLGIDPASPHTVPDAAGLRAVLRAAAEARIIVGLSCEDHALVTARLADQPATDPAAFAASRHESGEVALVTLGAALALETGARLHIRQVSVPWSLHTIAHYRDRGADISFEVTPHNLALDERDAHDARQKVVPPLRASETAAGLRELLAAGDVDMVATDHAPHAPQEKDLPFAEAPGGLPGLETLLPALLGILGPRGLPHIAEVAARRPAERFGLAAKGALEPGRDADLVLLDPEAPGAPEVLHTRAGYSAIPAEGLRGSILRTLLRGRTVALGRCPTGPRQGRLLLPEGRSCWS